MSDDQLEMLLPEYKGNPTAYALLVSLADTGARLAEIVGLEAQDLDLATGCLHIRQNSLRRLKTKHQTAASRCPPGLQSASDSSKLDYRIPTPSSPPMPDLVAVMRPPPC